MNKNIKKHYEIAQVSNEEFMESIETSIQKLKEAKQELSYGSNGLLSILEDINSGSYWLLFHLVEERIKKRVEEKGFIYPKEYDCYTDLWLNIWGERKINNISKVDKMINSWIEKQEFEKIVDKNPTGGDDPEESEEE